MDKFARSWALMKESYAVLRRTPSLMAFPVISAIAAILATAAFFIPFYVATGFRDIEQTRPEVYIPVLSAYYLVTYFVVIFFNTGLVSCAHESLLGRSTSFGQGMQAAASKMPAILGWTLIAATVGMVLRLIGEYFGTVGRIIEGVLGLAWGIVTYFVLPIMVVEHGSPVAAIKKSAGLFKKTWGERLIAAGGMGLAILLLSLAPIPWIVIVAFTGKAALIVPVVLISVLYWIGLAVVGAALQGIYQVALYVYASTGTTPEAFGATNFADAFRTKPGMKDTFAKWRGR